MDRKNVSRLLREEEEGWDIKVPVPTETGCYTKKAKITKTQRKIEAKRWEVLAHVLCELNPPSPGRVTHAVTPILHEPHLGNWKGTA